MGVFGCFLASFDHSGQVLWVCLDHGGHCGGVMDGVGA